MTSDMDSLESSMKSLDLAEKDISRIKRMKARRDINFRVLAIFEAVITVFSGLIGYGLGSSSYGYPYGLVLLSGSRMKVPDLKRKRMFILTLIITPFIILTGFTAGWAAGRAVSPATTTLYGVHFSD